MEPVTKSRVDFKKIIEVAKIFTYSVVFCILLLLVILAVLNKNINLSKIFNSNDSKAEFLEQLKALPSNR